MHLPVALHLAADEAKARFWVFPAAGVVVATAVGALLSMTDPAPPGSLAWLAWPGDVESARDMLSLLAGTIMTVTSLSFSLTVVALQLASQQFSPRLLRTFVSDPVVQGTLAVFLGTFAYCIVVLRSITEDDTGPPTAAMIVTMLLAAASVAALVRFISHIVQFLRVDTLLTRAASETRVLLRTLYPQAGPDGRPAPVPPADAVVAPSARSGWVQAVDLDTLVRWCSERDLVARVDVTPGDHVIEGVPVARLWATGTSEPPRDQDLVRLTRTVLKVGTERTPQSDVAFGFRQIADIAVKAMSPGVNDPTTAITAVAHLSTLLSAVRQRRLGDTVHDDDAGETRVVATQRSFSYLLDLCCGELRRYASAEPSVLVALLGLCRDVGAAARTEGQRQAVAQQITLVVRAAERGVDEPADLGAVRAAADEARRALAGRWQSPDGRSPRAADSISA